MANLFVSYDLMKADKNYPAVIDAIKKLSGSWATIHYSLWYVNANMTAADAAKRVWSVMDSNDRLIVIDTSNNSAAWYNLGDTVEKYMQNKWLNK